MNAPRVTPQEAWDALSAGNDRFIAGGPQHPRQDVERRNQLAGVQKPDAALFGCSDSRLAAEIIFDAGLGDLFVARNMGHVVAESITASMEYAVANLGVAIIVVLAHDSCGAVSASIDLMAQDPDPVPVAVENTLQPILPAVQDLWLRENRNTPYVDRDLIDADAVGRVHLGGTVNALLRSSRIISDAVAAGRLGIVGCQYKLAEGRAVPISAVGPLDIATDNLTMTDL
ncbi:carbonic anhydrase [Leucobacter insecticola]|uniref:carbonic anhydrase n=1 Tax=Leucobacter insecticola TaxID=2714934 RepID=A0A6G8FLN1_9MICO|nr:carbonic anhydrase [Leucobacter insecticola]QIM17193.1 carbonic anhydrase [Leucobacter insecticola]